MAVTLAQVSSQVTRHILDDKDGRPLPMIVGGYYNWHRVFGGEFLNIHDVTERHIKEYDILMVGLTTYDLKYQLLSKLRRMIGDHGTKLIVHPDYSVDAWYLAYQPEVLINELRCADMVFAPGREMVSYLKTIVGDDVPVHYIVHPTDVDKVTRHSQPVVQRQREIVIILHEYDKNWYPAYLITRNLPWKVHIVVPPRAQQIATEIQPYFPSIAYGGDDYPRFVSWISKRFVMLDTYQWFHSYGRINVECAALGVPIVGTTSVDSQKRLWPDLTVTPGDIYSQREMITKLMTDQEYYDDCCKYAADHVSEYSYDYRKLELLEKLQHGEVEGTIQGNGGEADTSELEGRGDTQSRHSDGDEPDKVVASELHFS